MMKERIKEEEERMEEEEEKKFEEMGQREREKAKRMRIKGAIKEIRNEREVNIETFHQDKFMEGSTSRFQKEIRKQKSHIDMKVMRRAWKRMNWKPKTMKMIREYQEGLLCVGKRRNVINKRKGSTKCSCGKRQSELNARHILTGCARTRREIMKRHDVVVMIVVNNIAKENE